MLPVREWRWVMVGLEKLLLPIPLPSYGTETLPHISISASILESTFPTPPSPIAIPVQATSFCLLNDGAERSALSPADSLLLSPAPVRAISKLPQDCTLPEMEEADSVV